MMERFRTHINTFVLVQTSHVDGVDVAIEPPGDARKLTNPNEEARSSQCACVRQQDQNSLRQKGGSNARSTALEHGRRGSAPSALVQNKKRAAWRPPRTARPRFPASPGAPARSDICGRLRDRAHDLHPRAPVRRLHLPYLFLEIVPTWTRARETEASACQECFPDYLALLPPLPFARANAALRAQLCAGGAVAATSHSRRGTLAGALVLRVKRGRTCSAHPTLLIISVQLAAPPSQAAAASFVPSACSICVAAICSVPGWRVAYLSGALLPQPRLDPRVNCPVRGARSPSPRPV